MSINSLLTFRRGWNLFLPGHGRGKALPSEIKNLLKQPGGYWDLPELPDLGGPLESFGEVQLSQKEAANRLGTLDCWYGVNGATGLLQAGLFAVLNPGEYVLMPRNVHKSLINACSLGDFRPIFFDLPFDESSGHYSPIDEYWVDKIIEELKNIRIKISAIVIVNPTYQGYSFDVFSVIKKFKELGLPILVDEAHGTHFATSLDLGLPGSAIHAGADLVVHSLHKSFNGLVQTAVLWLQGEKVIPSAVTESLALFQTSSPSSLLLASCEAAINDLMQPYKTNKLVRRIAESKVIFQKLKRLGVPLISNQDPLRLIINTASVGITGFEADNWFINNGFVAELPEPGSLTFCLGLACHKGFVKSFYKCWTKLNDAYSQRDEIKSFAVPPLDLLSIPSKSFKDIKNSTFEQIELENSFDRISCDLICPYPPGIPMLVPGEKINKSRIDWLLNQKLYWKDQIPSKIRVVA
tara:strand:+ start:2204 stop:3601 length:1398 start_codon:yes stop_codon:yes gene_type:complete